MKNETIVSEDTNTKEAKGTVFLHRDKMFDVAPFLDEVTMSGEPSEYIRALNEAMEKFFQYFSAVKEAPSEADANIYFNLRRLRDAIVVGAGGKTMVL